MFQAVVGGLRCDGQHLKLVRIFEPVPDPLGNNNQLLRQQVNALLGAVHQQDDRGGS